MQMSSRFDASEEAGPSADDGMRQSLTTTILCPPGEGEPGVEDRDGEILPNLGPTSAAPQYRRSLFRR
jgi:hypothetical protein